MDTQNKIDNKDNTFVRVVKILQKRVSIFYVAFVAPLSKEEDARRHEGILNTLLIGSLLLSSTAVVSMSLQLFALGAEYRGASPALIIGIFIIFFNLYLLSRFGYYLLALYIFLAIYFSIATHIVYTWGIDLPQGLLIFALLIVMSGMLVSARFSFLTACLSSFVIILLAYLQNHLITHPNLYWKKEMLKVGDAAVIAATFFVISIVSWLSDREIRRSLARAVESEAALKKERDLLEIKVEERTHALKEAQLQKTIELSQFAEFGQMTSGLFHDLLNPLTAVSLHLGNLKKEKVRISCSESNTSLDHVIKGVEQIRTFSENALKQIQTQEAELLFSVAHEISSTIQMLSYKALRANVLVEFAPPPLIQTYGNPLLFYRVIMNLVANAIDSYADVPYGNRERRIKVFLSEDHGLISLAIQDFGCGIKKENLSKVFDPLFTTKDSSKGTGLGLSICKDIIEKRYRGSIRVESEEGKGTLVLAVFPKTYHKELKRLYDESQNHP